MRGAGAMRRVRRRASDDAPYDECRDAFDMKKERSKTMPCFAAAAAIAALLVYAAERHSSFCTVRLRHAYGDAGEKVKMRARAAFTRDTARRVSKR